MKKTPPASVRIHTDCVSTFRMHFYPSKMGISKFCSAFLILALLLQVLIIGPIRSARAGGRIPLTAPITAPPEPFRFQNSLSDSDMASSLTTTLLSELPNPFNWPAASDDFSVNNTLAFMRDLAVGGASLFSLIDSEPKTIKPEPRTIAPEPKEVANPNPAEPPMMTAAGSVTFDFDGDGRADASRWHPATHEFKIKNSNGNNSYSSTMSLGNSSSRPVAGDFNWDNKTDVAVFTPGTTDTWSYILSPLPAGSATPQTITLGVPGSSDDIPVYGIFDSYGEGPSVGVFRPSTGNWYLKQGFGSTIGPIHFGPSGNLTGSLPVTGDFDGDGKTDLVIYRLEIPPGETDYHSHWYLHKSSGVDVDFWWGLPGDIPVEGDFDGDGMSNPTVYRPSDGTWYVATLSGSIPTQIAAVGWGNYADQPVPADYDGDGFTDYAVWRPTNGIWYIKSSNPENIPGFGTPYLYETLGNGGDTALPSVYTPQVGGTVTASALASARLAPINETGTTNLYSQNFSWGSSLVSLPGRAGLNAGLGISYNSLLWLRSGSTMYFDPDFSNVGPGFRFGFPVIEPAYWDSRGFWAYMMVTPNGGRLDFRQKAVSNTYETGDSSYTQLVTTGANSPNDPVENIGITVTTTDGTQMNYVWKGGAFRCTKILDRNGNFITVNHDEQGVLRSVTDTLGRAITIDYDGELYPTQIKQAWKNNNGVGGGPFGGITQHAWATFTYDDVQINTNWDSNNGITAMEGPPNGTNLRVLTRITYADQSYTQFMYNNYGQVRQVENYATNGDRLNYVRTNLDSVSDPQPDCPRFTETDTYIKNFNNENVVRVTNSPPANSSFSAGDILEENTKVVNVRTIDPNNIYTLYTRLHFAGSDPVSWRVGLPVATEDCTGGYNESECDGRQRWTWTNWTQDVDVAWKGCYVTSVYYPRNPRVQETRVGDNNNNIKRTSINYLLEEPNCSGGGSQIINNALFGLVGQIDLYDGNLGTLLKRSVNEYNLSTQYLSRRIIGLPIQTLLYDENEVLMSQVTYGYDEWDFSDSSLQQTLPSNTSQHDNAYGASFAYRGNLTSKTRHDVLGESSPVTSSIKYNTAGSPVAQIDPVGRVSKISYNDTNAWNDNVARTTYAYPTTVTDPGNNSSTIKYRHDMGARIEATSPAPAGNTHGKKTKWVFDTLGRLDNESVYVNTTKKAYTRYEYPTNGIQSKVYSTIVDTNNNGPDSEDEVLTESWTDGAGRVYKARIPHTFNSNGTIATWSATQTNYDILGRVIAQLVPTEVDASWNKTGDDATRDWLWKSQEYDWKGRVTRTVNTDGSDTLAIYDGCGCAGGQITTLQSEAVPQSEAEPTSRRTKRTYADALGRIYKAELLNWNGEVYKTQLNWFNGRDQIIFSREVAGSESSSNYQETTLTYDGHGRTKTQHRPAQDADKSTIFTYFADDKLQSKIDANGTRETYTYDNRSLLIRTDYDTLMPQNIDNLTPIIHGLENGGPSNRYYIIIKGNNFGTNPQVLVNHAGGATAVYQGGQLQRSESNGDQFIAIDLQTSSERNSLVNPPGIGVSVKNQPSNKASSKAMIRVTLANVLGLNNPEYTYAWDLGSPAIIPEANLPATSVTYEHDNLGNVTRMTDGMGEQLYEYDSLSRLTSERRNFAEQLPTQIVPANGFKIQYEYGMSGQLTKVTDPYGEQVKYGQDKIGRLDSVSGIEAGTQTNLQYISETKYRAFGLPKKVVYGTSTSVETDYNNQVLPLKTSIRDLSTNNISEFNYQFNADGKLRFSSEQGDFPGKFGTDIHNFDRAFDYDFIGRLTLAKTGAEARGQIETDFTKRPYRMIYNWDSFGHLTEVDTFHWTESYPDEPKTFINEREPAVTTPSPITPLYDSEGRKYGTNYNGWDAWEANFDMAGRLARDPDEKFFYSGNGSMLKKVDEDVPRIVPQQGRIEKSTATKYNIYSSVLGEVVNELAHNTWDSWPTSQQSPPYTHAESAMVFATNIYAFGKRIARKSGEVTQINVEDAAGNFYQEKTIAVNASIPNPQLYFTTNSMELDPFNASVGETNPYPAPGQTPDPDDGCGGVVWEDGEWQNEPPCGDDGTDPPEDEDAGIGNVGEKTCYVNGFEMECRDAMNLPQGSSVVHNGPDFVRVNFFGKENTFAFFHAFADGYSGYIPINANYLGDGVIDPISTGNPELDSRFIYSLTQEMMVLAAHSGRDTTSKDVRIDVAEFARTLLFTGIDEFWERVASSRNPSERSRKRIDDSTLNNWRPLLDKAINVPGCADFINKYVGGANLLNVFDLVRKQQGFAVNPTVGPFAAAETNGAVVKSKVGTGVGAGIDFRTGDRNTADMIMTLIHELVHASSSGRDDVSMANLLEANGVNLIIPPNQRVGDPTYIASLNWDEELKKACKVTPEMVKQWTQR